jgi:hypothetical protein
LCRSARSNAGCIFIARKFLNSEIQVLLGFGAPLRVVIMEEFGDMQVRNRSFGAEANFGAHIERSAIVGPRRVSTRRLQGLAAR